MGIETIVLKKLISAKNNGNLAIFIGAGVSLSSNTSISKIPLWKEIIDKIKDEINETKETDYLKIAQYYFNNMGKKLYYEKLFEMFPKNIHCSKIHEKIFDINPDIIITTNWDDLLEQENKNNARFYDVIVTDREFVKSDKPHKIIKMHGDFAHNNIVFKEDDYLNYQENFPLIENYIKSILSTHAVLFLGYSYSDINLKIIMQWLKNKSGERPKMYLVTFDISANQEKYLENNNITTVVLSDINNNLLYIDKFDQYSKILYTFLHKLHTQIDNDVLLKEEDTISFVLEKLNIFTGLNIMVIPRLCRGD
jgi:hypothetical protein